MYSTFIKQMGNFISPELQEYLVYQGQQLRYNPYVNQHRTSLDKAQLDKAEQRFLKPYRWLQLLQLDNALIDKTGWTIDNQDWDTKIDLAEMLHRFNRSKHECKGLTVTDESAFHYCLYLVK